MSKMTEALDRISAYHRNKPGMSMEEIERMLSSFPFRLSDEAYEFYQWAGAPIGDAHPEDWDGSYNDCSTYLCALESLLQGVDDIFHFMSLEEFVRSPPYLSDNNPEWLPIFSSEYSNLVISGSKIKTATSPVLKVEDGKVKLWFLSLTNMMLAIAESEETIGTILPKGLESILENIDDEDYGTEAYKEKIREKFDMVVAIAKKYGSPSGDIIAT
jgi:hypothetical protein